MKRSGLLKRIDKQIWPDETAEAVHQSERNVTLGTVAVFLFILCAGVAISIVILLMEIFWYKFCQLKWKKTQLSSKQQKLECLLFRPKQ
jgi:hypothetical protein